MRLLIKNKVYFITLLGIFAGILAVLSVFEGMFGFNFGVPGVKFGLSNIVIVLSLYVLEVKYAVFLTILKIIFSIIFSGGISGFMFTACGSIASIISMIIIKKILNNKVSAVGVSAVGGICHITAQYICSYFILGTLSIFKIYPVASFLSLLTSVGVGLICNLFLERVYKNEVENAQ